jgi:hypothetical protein
MERMGQRMERINVAEGQLSVDSNELQPSILETFLRPLGFTRGGEPVEPQALDRKGFRYITRYGGVPLPRHIPWFGVRVHPEGIYPEGHPEPTIHNPHFMEGGSEIIPLNPNSVALNKITP